MFKKTLLPLLFLSSALFFTSCNDDDDDDTPITLTLSLSVSELNTGNIDGGDFTITEGESLKFAINAQDGSEDMDEFNIVVTGANSTSSIPISTEGNTFPLSLSGSNEQVYQDTVTFINGATNIGVTNYTFTVTNDNGAISTVSYDITVETADDLFQDTFAWTRVGGNTATGPEQFGLLWDDNFTVGGTTSAIVVDDEATVFVDLTEDNWTNITNSMDLADAINDAFAAGAGLETDGYTNVSAQQSADDYNDYLGVIYQGEPYIIFVQSATVTSDPSEGTTIVIEGFFKS
jgi:hypothetical protein